MAETTYVHRSAVCTENLDSDVMSSHNLCC
jgi:hypothetical protein